METPAPEAAGEAGLRRALAVAGAVLLLFVAAELLAYKLVDGVGAGALARGLAVELVLGREPALPIALGGGAPPWLVAQLSATQDIAIGALAFPLFLYALARYRDAPNFVMRKLRDLEAEARKHEAFARRWGPLGLFAFMLVPFLVNGPLVGAAVGRLAGIPTRHLILPVVGSVLVASFAWTYFYNRLFALTGNLHPLLAPAITIGLVAIFLGLALLNLGKKARKTE
ncbi:MAG: small multi-drug export protein [Candidatus Thermoplasmatota archaeon]